MKYISNWLFNKESLYDDFSELELEQIEPFRLGLFLLIHICCLGIIITGVSWFAALLCLFLYLTRMFFITGFYHRYFSHRTYRVNRSLQLLMAIAGCTAGQRGPLWWASHHRHHHVNSDTKKDPHSPKNGNMDSHMFWFLRRKNFPVHTHLIKDLTQHPELIWLEKFDWAPFILLGLICYLIGDFGSIYYPVLDTTGLQTLVWGFFISTTLLYHATYTINSLCHKIGSRRFNTSDDSRNNGFLALLTLGEGWHNNHHRYPLSTRQGFIWWELDISYQVLKLLSTIGLVHDMHPVPASIINEAKRA